MQNLLAGVINNIIEILRLCFIPGIPPIIDNPAPILHKETKMKIKCLTR